MVLHFSVTYLRELEISYDGDNEGNAVRGREAPLNSTTVPKRLPIDVAAALHAICSTGKGRCWYCDGKLPGEAEALRSGWDVQRFDEQPVASIILVCPCCLRQQEADDRAVKRVPMAAADPSRRGRDATP